MTHSFYAQVPPPADPVARRRAVEQLLTLLSLPIVAVLPGLSLAVPPEWALWAGLFALLAVNAGGHMVWDRADLWTTTTDQRLMVLRRGLLWSRNVACAFLLLHLLPWLPGLGQALQAWQGFIVGMLLALQCWAVYALARSLWWVLNGTYEP